MSVGHHRFKALPCILTLLVLWVLAAIHLEDAAVDKDGRGTKTGELAHHSSLPLTYATAGAWCPCQALFIVDLKRICSLTIQL
jgi:hypothetical protein